MIQRVTFDSNRTSRRLARRVTLGLVLLGLAQPAWAAVSCLSHFAAISNSSAPEGLTANAHWQLIDTVGRNRVSLPTLEKLIAAENPFEIPEQGDVDLGSLRTKMKTLEGMVREKLWYTPDTLKAIRTHLTERLDILRKAQTKQEVSVEETLRHSIDVIERKHNAKEALSPSELRFLYELNTEGFKFSADPRFKNIRKQRDKKKDLALAIGGGITEAEISLTPEEAVRGSHFHYGNLELSSLTLAQGLTLPTTVQGSLNLSRLTSAEGLKLPTTVQGSLYLSRLTSAQGLTLPNTVQGDLNLDGLTSAKGLTLPTTVQGDLYLGSLTSAKGLTLPTTVPGSLWLGSLTSAQGLTLPTTVPGSLYLNGLTSAQGLTLPTTVQGSLWLVSLTSAQGLTLPLGFKGSYHGPNIP